MDAFNAGSVEAVAALLAEDAVAWVEGAPFPREEGADNIRATSLPHLLEGNRLRAIPGSDWIWLQNGNGELEVAIEWVAHEGRMTSLRYVTAPHAGEELQRLAVIAGMPAASA